MVGNLLWMVVNVARPKPVAMFLGHELGISAAANVGCSVILG